jgi:Anti-sigma-28 factor, FlgM
MYSHGPNCLAGPVSRKRPCWTRSARTPDAPIRRDLVERVRREIADGTYDTPAKWDKALDRLFDRLQDG